MKGRIVKVGGGRFSVMTETGVAEYSAKGSLKIKGEGLVTGDIAEIENGVVIGTERRKNRLFRPNVCNVDVVNIVVGDPPKPDFYLVDKMISKCFFENIPCVITVNKIDLGEENKRTILENYEKAVEKIFFVSALDGEGIDDLTEYLKGKLVVFTGQSAVGKTSLCNRLFGGSRRVGDVSEKTKRGRQTTTSCEIVRSGDLLVADTPGFTSIDCDLLPEDLPHSYPEFEPWLGLCRFKDCKHEKEPGCRVAEEVSKGNICNERYRRYLEILKESRQNAATNKNR